MTSDETPPFADDEAVVAAHLRALLDAGHPRPDTTDPGWTAAALFAAAWADPGVFARYLRDGVTAANDHADIVAGRMEETMHAARRAFAEHDPHDARRALRIQRAAIGLVLHAHQGARDGVALAAAELAAEGATIGEIVPLVAWAAARLPRSVAEPDDLREQLAVLAAVRDRQSEPETDDDDGTPR